MPADVESADWRTWLLLLNRKQSFVDIAWSHQQVNSAQLCAVSWIYEDEPIDLSYTLIYFALFYAEMRKSLSCHCAANNISSLWLLYANSPVVDGAAVKNKEEEIHRIKSNCYENKAIILWSILFSHARLPVHVAIKYTLQRLNKINHRRTNVKNRFCIMKPNKVYNVNSALCFPAQTTNTLKCSFTKTSSATKIHQHRLRIFCETILS